MANKRDAAAMNIEQFSEGSFTLSNDGSKVLFTINRRGTVLRHAQNSGLTGCFNEWRTCTVNLPRHGPKCSQFSPDGRRFAFEAAASSKQSRQILNPILGRWRSRRMLSRS